MSWWLCPWCSSGCTEAAQWIHAGVKAIRFWLRASGPPQGRVLLRADISWRAAVQRRDILLRDRGQVKGCKDGGLTQMVVRCKSQILVSTVSLLQMDFRFVPCSKWLMDLMAYFRCTYFSPLGHFRTDICYNAGAFPFNWGYLKTTTYYPPMFYASVVTLLSLDGIHHCWGIIVLLYFQTNQSQLDLIRIGFRILDWNQLEPFEGERFIGRNGQSDAGFHIHNKGRVLIPCSDCGSQTKLTNGVKPHDTWLFKSR